MADGQSILNYYKTAMTLRNRFPSIARGTVENLSEGQNNYICILRKTYQEECIVIVFNLDSFEQVISVDKEALGVSGIAGELLTDTTLRPKFDGEGNLKLPPKSIVILK